MMGKLDPPTAPGLFLGGRSGFLLGGDWNRPTLVDAEAKHQLPFDYEILPLPKFYQAQRSWADSHSFAMPGKGNTLSPEKLAAVLQFIAYVEKHSLEWAEGGHIPAYLPVTNSAAYSALKPNVEYRRAADTSPTILTRGSPGVAGPLYQIAARDLNAGHERADAGGRRDGRHDAERSARSSASMSGVHAQDVPPHRASGVVRPPPHGAHRLVARGRAVWFVGPFAVIYVCFFAYPMVHLFVLSFTHTRLGNPTGAFVGTSNYARLLHDPAFWGALVHTLSFVVLTVIPLVLVGLLLAMLVLRVRPAARCSCRRRSSCRTSSRSAS